VRVITPPPKSLGDRRPWRYARRMAPRVCPWWLGWLLVSPLRRIVHDPAALLAPFVREGMTVLEPGPGMGFFTLEAARRVGPRGRVVAVDLQPRMLAGLRRRAARAGLAERIEARESNGDVLGIADLAGKVDLALALWMVHEVPDAGRFFGEVRAALAPGGRVLVVEPRGHVTEVAFGESLAAAARAGLRGAPGPRVWRSVSALLQAA
jgi:SAM-dependent methyltransferase